MTTTPRRTSMAIFALAAGLLAGCDSGDPPAPAPANLAPTGGPVQPAASAQPAAAPSAPAGGPIVPKPGRVSGRAVDAAGRPLEGVRIAIGGNTFQGGENAHFRTTTKADGTYDLPVPHGLYSVRAMILREYHGRSYLLPLHPSDGKTDSYDSAEGIVKEFIWRLSGLKPGHLPGSTAEQNYYGSSIQLRDRNSYEKRVGFDADKGPGSRPAGKHFEFPAGSVLHFTLKPDGPLIDGSAGAPVTFKLDIRKGMNYDFNWQARWIDIPVGRYALSGEVTLPGGAPDKPLRVAAVSEQDSDRAKTPLPGATTVVDFLPDTTQTYAGGTHANEVYVME